MRFVLMVLVPVLFPGVSHAAFTGFIKPYGTDRVAGNEIRSMLVNVSGFELNKQGDVARSQTVEELKPYLRTESISGFCENGRPVLQMRLTSGVSLKQSDIGQVVFSLTRSTTEVEARRLRVQPDRVTLILDAAQLLWIMESEHMDIKIHTKDGGEYPFIQSKHEWFDAGNKGKKALESAWSKCWKW